MSQQGSDRQMTGKTTCPNCRATYRDAISDGTSILCPACGERFTDGDGRVVPGDTLGAYAVDAYLGHGQLGETYLVTGPDGKTKYVLKCLDRRLKVDERLLNEALERLLRLAAIPALRLPTRLEMAGDQRFLLQAYVDGESLEARVRRDGPMAEAEALGFARTAAVALQAAWERDAMPHRYVKPANLVVGTDGALVLTDMGYAEIVGEGRAIWTPGLEFGTPHYLSPEQAWDAGMADFRADIYGLGAVLYMLVTGQPPYTGTTPEVYAKLAKEEPVLAATIHNTRVSTGLNDLLRLMLASQPQQRHGSWETLIADLDLVASGSSPTRKLVPPSAPRTLEDAGFKRVGSPQPAQPTAAPEPASMTDDDMNLMDSASMSLRKVNDGKTKEHKSVYNIEVATGGDDSKMAITESVVGTKSEVNLRRMAPKATTPPPPRHVVHEADAPPVLIDPEAEKTRTIQKVKAKNRKKTAGKAGIIIGSILVLIVLGVLVRVMYTTWQTRSNPANQPAATESVPES